MTKMTELIFKTQGTVDKYIGDAVVALWGAPHEVSGHPQLAVQCAVEMIEMMKPINEYFVSKNIPAFKVGIGLNSGECSVGNMGSNLIFSYTALGDNMNLGARLEGLCKYYGAQIIISEFTFERLEKGMFKTRPLDRVKVKGKENPVLIYEVLHAHHAFFQDTISLQNYLSAYEAFKKGHFGDACKTFGALHAKYPEDKAVKRLHEVCCKYIEHPPEPGSDFDVTKMTEK